MKKKTISSFSLILFYFLISVTATNAAPKAPGFALVNNRGSYVLRSKLKGNLIISFWASYCKPCKKEMPVMVNIEKKYGKLKDLKLIFINVDTNKGKPAKEKADAMLKEIGIKHDYLMDPYQRTVIKYNPEIKVPATFLINKKGYIVFKELGYHKDTMKKLEKAIKKLK